VAKVGGGKREAAFWDHKTSSKLLSQMSISSSRRKTKYVLHYSSLFQHKRLFLNLTFMYRPNTFFSSGNYRVEHLLKKGFTERAAFNILIFSFLSVLPASAKATGERNKFVLVGFSILS